jgi:tetratricopeptide (TPR) repeat protein
MKIQRFLFLVWLSSLILCYCATHAYAESLDTYSIPRLEELATKARNEGNFSAAEAFLNEILRREPNNLAARSGRGRIRHDQNNYSAALEDFTVVITALQSGRTWPTVTLPHLLHRKASTLIGMQKFPEALQAADAAIELQPTYVNALNTRALILETLKREREAFETYQAAAKLAPGSLFIHTNLVALAVSLKLYEEAISYCTTSKDKAFQAEADVVSGNLDASSLSAPIPVNPSPALFYWDCAVAAREAGNDQTLRHEFLMLAASAPAYDAKDLFYRGEAKRELNELDAALADYRESLSRSTSNATAFNRAGRILYDQKKLEEASHLYGDFIDAHPKNGSAYQGRSSILFELNRMDEAVSDARRATELEPDAAVNWSTLAYAYQKTGDRAAAAEAYARVLALEPSNVVARAYTAYALQEKEDFAGVLEVLKPIIESGKGDAGTYEQYGFALHSLERWEEARQAYSASIEKDPSNAGAYIRRSLVLYKLGFEAEAAKDAQHAYELDPSNTVAQGGRAFFALKRVDGASPSQESSANAGIPYTLGYTLGTLLHSKIHAAQH